MTEIITLIIFCTLIVLCVVFDISVVYALAAGLLIFACYGRYKKFSLKEIFCMYLNGIKTVKNVLISFMLIGILTALWRDCGTIASIICYLSGFIIPSVFLISAFLLNCLISVLTGTSFGTAATMGVICTSIAQSLGINPAFAGGAVLSGIYFGDRCSPVSSSALLVSELTCTNLYKNIKNMLRSAFVPAVFTCCIYFFMGLVSPASYNLPDIRRIFADEFCIHWVCLLPAAVIMLLSFMKINIKAAMSASIATCIPISIFLQQTPVYMLLDIVLNGYRSSSADFVLMLDGGGIKSMLNVMAIVCISSAYSDLFQKTDFFKHIETAVVAISQKFTAYSAFLAVSLITGVIACSQTFTIMLTYQLCGKVESDRSKAALWLEDSAVVTSALIPWSIACAVPLSSVGAPTRSVFFAFFLYLLPLWRLLCEFAKKYISEKSELKTVQARNAALQKENDLLKDKLNQIQSFLFPSQSH